MLRVLPVQGDFVEIRLVSIVPKQTVVEIIDRYPLIFRRDKKPGDNLRTTPFEQCVRLSLDQSVRRLTVHYSAAEITNPPGAGFQLAVLVRLTATWKDIAFSIAMLHDLFSRFDSIQ